MLIENGILHITENDEFIETILIEKTDLDIKLHDDLCLSSYDTYFVVESVQKKEGINFATARGYNERCADSRSNTCPLSIIVEKEELSDMLDKAVKKEELSDRLGKAVKVAALKSQLKIN